MIPHMEELKEFAKIVNEGKISELCTSVNSNNTLLKEAIERMYYSSGYRIR